MTKKAATKDEKRHIEIVKSLLCVVCDEAWYDKVIKLGGKITSENWDFDMPLCEYDHLVDGYRLGHFYGNPLCKKHHEGKKGYGPKEYHWDSSKRNQWRLLEKVYKVLGKEIPPYNPKGRNNFHE